MRISDWSSDVCSSDLLVRASADPLRPSGLFQRHRFHGQTQRLELRPDLGRVADHHPDEILWPDHRACGLVEIGRAHRAITAGQRLLIIVRPIERSEETTSELQSLMRHSFSDFCLKKKKTQ